MKKQVALSAVFAAIAVFSHGAFAQASMPMSRAEVKAQAKTGSIPAGEATTPGQAMAPSATSKSTKTRMERKEETKMAKDAGKLKPAGEAANLKDEKAEKSAPSTTNRADRKAATKAAVGSGTTLPAGDSATPGLPAKK